MCDMTVNLTKHGLGNALHIFSTHLLEMQLVEVSGSMCDVSAIVP